MKAFFTTNDLFEEALLFLSWNDLVLVLFCKSLVSCKAVAQLINEITHGKSFVLIKVAKLQAKDGVIVRIF